MSLTLVVPTIPGRESLLSRCLWSITNQCQLTNVLVVDGSAPLGDKINAAARFVGTEHMAVIDDDDYISADYLESVLPWLEFDFVGHQFLEVVDGRYYNTTSSSADVALWGARTRGPVAKCPTRTSIVRQVRFGNDYKADRRWSNHARELISTSAFVPRALYIHDWWPGQSAFGDTAEARDVGMWPHDPVDRLTINRGGSDDA